MPDEILRINYEKHVSFVTTLKGSPPLISNHVCIGNVY